MPAKAPLLRFWICLWTIFALVPVAAQEPTPDPKASLQMTLSSPFALTAKPLLLLAKRGKWFPVAITLSNTGEPVAGDVHLKLLGGGDAPANDFTASVDLPTNARKVVWLYGRLERPNIQTVQISFEGRGFERLSQRVPISEPNDGQRVILTVSDVDSGLGEALRGLRGNGLSLSSAVDSSAFNPGFNSSGSQGPLRPLETGREGVPDRWIGMDGADLVILGDFAHSALAPPQIAALRGYVAGGGNLLALGGANAPRLAASPLADLWPATIAGSVTASASQTAKIVERYVETPAKRALSGADRLGGSPLLTARGALKSGAQLKLGTPDQPLFSFQNNGAGRVLLLGFDPSQPPFNGWSGQNGLWRGVFGAATKVRVLESVDGQFAGLGPSFSPNNGGFNGGFNGGYDGGQNDTVTGRLLGALGTAQQRRTPPVSQIAWFLALYVFVLVPLNYAILRFIDRRELAWISIPVIVAAFSYFAYSTALSIRGKQILTRQVDIVQSSLGSSSAHTDSLLWLFSPRTTTYTLESSVKSAVITDYATQEGVEQGTFSVVQPVDSSGFRAQNAPVRIWIPRTFSARSVIDLGKGLTRVGDRVQNGTPFDLQGVVWVQDRQARAIGALKSGASAPIPAWAAENTNGVDLPGAIARASEVRKIFGGEIEGNGIPANALMAALGEGFGRQNEGAFLIGWSKKVATPLSIGVSGAKPSALTLFVLRADAFQNPRTAGQLAGREAVVTKVSSEPTTAFPGAVGGTDVYECLLPDAPNFRLEVRGVRNDAASQRFAPGQPFNPVSPAKPGALPVGVSFEVNDPTKNGWKTLAGRLRRDKQPANGWNFSANIGRELAREPDRLLQIRVRRDNDRSRVSMVRVVSAK